MLIEEILSETLIKHYSDEGYLIRQIETGTLYDEAIDLIPCRYTYEETDEPIEKPEEDDIPDDSQDEEGLSSEVEEGQEFEQAQLD